MDFSHTPINQEEQMKQIIKDTNEIIRNFKEISEIFAEKIEYTGDPMLNLGRKLIKNREEKTESDSTLDGEQINFIM